MRLKGTEILHNHLVLDGVDGVDGVLQNASPHSLKHYFLTTVTLDKPLNL